jgi:spoIIIJ-associated protein
MMDESIIFAKKYLEDLLSFFGLNTVVVASSSDEVVELAVPSSPLNGFLIGFNGETLRSLQYIVSSALKNGNYLYYRVNVDVGNYKKNYNDKLTEEALLWIENVKTSGEPFNVRPMNAADRRIVHKAVFGGIGVVSESVGEMRDRHVVIKPAA